MTNWIAGIASIFVAGLGQVINGEFTKGLKIFLTMVLIGGLNLGLNIMLPELAGLTQIVLGLLAGAVYFIQLGDAFGAVEAENFIPYL